MKIDGVDQVCVVGIPDPEFQHLTAAAIVKKNGYEDLTEEKVKECIASEVPDHKQLHGGVFFMKSLPMTVSGKIVKKAVLDSIKVSKTKAQ